MGDFIPEGYDVRPLAAGDGPGLAAAYERNREHLRPWDPARPPEFYTAGGQSAVVAEQLESVERRRLAVWVLEREGSIVGRVAINNIVWGVLRSGAVGYWVDHEHTRRGLATGCVRHACAEALAMGLHRVEAGTMVHNEASQGVLRRCGFRQFGTARSFLYLAGAWQDHHLFERILHDDPL